MIKRCSSSRISRRTPSMSRLVAKSASPCASLKASENASAWISGTPASFKVRINLCVSNVIVPMLTPIYIYLRSSLTEFDNTTNPAYHLRSVTHLTGGFDRLIKQGAEVTRRPVRGFFYALHFLVDGVLGSCKARWVLASVCQPDILSAAQILTALSGGLKPFARSYS